MNGRRAIALLLVLTGIYPVLVGRAHSQALSLAAVSTVHSGSASVVSVCKDTALRSSLKDAFRLACLRTPPAGSDVAIRNTIVVGFVGGLVKHNDARHPEVRFAGYLRDRYPNGVHAEVFANHEGKEALRYVLRFLDSNGDGLLTEGEKEQANIIIYGHSWGASQTVTLARELGRQGIPVLLTIQVDSIAKLGQHDSTISGNVEKAVNFYQPGGLLHGRATIIAADPSRTKILGNFRMTYEDRRINCDNYPWFARVFNKPHHKIENDPRVWDQIASLIDSELSSTRSTAQESSLQAPLLK
jgi:hypothetical protein